MKLDRIDSRSLEPALIIVVAIASLWGARAADPDLFARVAVGRIVELTGWIAPIDPFSFTALAGLWIDHEWLSGVVFYQLSRFGGDPALWWLKWALFACFVWALWSAETERRSPILFFAALSGTLYLWAATIRCQTFTYMLLALLLLLMGRAPKPWRGATLLLLPLAILFWTNLHGGVVLGCLTIGIFTVVRLRENPLKELPLLCACVLSFAVTLINPWGALYWSYLFPALTMERPNITEWVGVSPLSPVGLFLGATLLLSAFGEVKLRREVNDKAFRIILLSIAAFAAFQSLRLTGWYFTVLAAYFIPELSTGLRAAVQLMLPRASFQAALQQVITVGFRCVGAVAAGFLIYSIASSPIELDYSRYPASLVEYLRGSGYSGRLLVGMNEGSFALWRLFPRFTVSLDGRYEEVYDSATISTVRCALAPRCNDGPSSFESLQPDIVLLRADRVPYWVAEKFLLERTEGGFSLYRRADLPRSAEPEPERSMWEPPMWESALSPRTESIAGMRRRSEGK